MVNQIAQVFRTVAEFAEWRKKVTGTVGFVATMGALHEGHLSLMRQARQSNDHLVVSIFVNPLQFAPGEDFGGYPRTFESDIEKCNALEVDAVLAPTTAEIYPEGQDSCTKIVPPAFLGDILEGAHRPGFFTGVATVVAKLFHIVEPNFTVFGKKDYQQLLVVKKMVHDLNMSITVYGASTVRAEDGLALSSRNAYLSEEQRKIAPRIYEALSCAAEKIRLHPVKLQEAVKEAHLRLSVTDEIKVQYLEARDAETLEKITAVDRKVVLLTAVKIGDVRLIDNIVIS